MPVVVGQWGWGGVVIKGSKNRDFPGGTVDKNLPANWRDTGSIPGLRRSHMLQSN